MKTNSQVIGPIGVTQYNWTEGSIPQVEVCVSSFNDGKFIGECIEGVLKQKTSFPIVLTLYDDASTDETPSIITEYCRRFPRLVRSVLSKENNYSRNRFQYFYNQVSCKSIAPYIAYCGADDYWIDPLKLEKQWRFLESNPEFVLSGHDCRVIDGEGNTLANSLVPLQDQRDATPESLSRNDFWISMATPMYRNVLRAVPDEFGRSIHQDSWLFSLLGAHGKYHYHSDIVPAAYRIHQGGLWSLKSKNCKLADWCNTLFTLHTYYHRIGRPDLSEYFLDKFRADFYRLADGSELLRACFGRVMNPLTWKGAIRKLTGQ
jgi:glycosyltransferase involved in cell wall biosynthesis